MHLDLGNDLQIREWRATDAAALVRHANNINVWRNLRDRFPHPYTMESARRWLDIANDLEPERAFAIATADEAIGGIGVHPFDDVYRLGAEIGYWLSEDWWGRGITTRAVRAFCDWSFATLGVVRLQASVFEGNPASARVLEKAGFVLEGRLRRNVVKDDQILDSLLYARLRDEAPPAAPAR